MTEDDSKRHLRIVRPGEEPVTASEQPPLRPSTDAYPPGTFSRIFDLTGRVALVVGGGGGLGRAISAGLADHGARLAVLDLSLEAAQDVGTICSRPGIEAFAAQLDVTDPDMVNEVVGSVEDACGRIDILINCVGINILRPFTDYTVEEWYLIINTNLSGTFFVTQAAARGMLARGYGRILTIGSVSSLLGHPYHAPYAATKGGIAIMTKSMATEWAPRGVTVNAIGPTYTETALTQDILLEPGRREKLTQAIPMGRLGRPDDLVGAAVYLCSDAARFVTGQTLYIDGGRTAD
jgi:gluconate 5-dehydrogenase